MFINVIAALHPAQLICKLKRVNLHLENDFVET